MSVGWHIIQSFTEYKAQRAGKAVFYVSPFQTSQECRLTPFSWTHYNCCRNTTGKAKSYFSVSAVTMLTMRTITRVLLLRSEQLNLLWAVERS
ncbi:zinc ribbon domain-containing protein [Thalassotalea litorea]|uniref:zinc ribbon domain-containing protein n=1 Tax=Thalassotalea litorea TaxID=2020715 RepID=UPI003735B969